MGSLERCSQSVIPFPLSKYWGVQFIFDYPSCRLECKHLILYIDLNWRLFGNLSLRVAHISSLYLAATFGWILQGLLPSKATKSNTCFTAPLLPLVVCTVLTRRICWVTDHTSFCHLAKAHFPIRVAKRAVSICKVTVSIDPRWSTTSDHLYDRYF